MTGWRTALRLAWREANRAKGRSVLIIAMITLPVAAMVFALINYATFDLSPRDKADRQMGAADAAVTWRFDSPVRQEPEHLRALPADARPAKPVPHTDDQLLAQFPAGTKAIRLQTDSLAVTTASGIGTVRVLSLDYLDPLAQGMLRPLSGRAPSAADEVALTPQASTRFGVGIDGTVRASDGSRTFRVTAIVENPSNLDDTSMITRSAASTADVQWLVRTPNPVTWADVKQLNTKGLAVLSRHVLANPPDSAERYDIGTTSDGGLPDGLVLVAGAALLEVMLLAGAAFAVGARRRRRDLALLAASGATPGHVSRIVLADGVVHGAIAAGTGVALGIAAAFGTLPLFEESVLRQRAGDVLIDPVLVSLVAALAVVTGALAALAPALISSRQDVVAALAGRKGITRTRRRWVLASLVLVAAGIAVSALGATQANFDIVLVGLFLGEIALVLATPSLIGLVAKVGRWLPPAARIALRDASRNRTAAAPAISAVMAAVLAALALGIVSGSEKAREESLTSMRPGDVFVVNAKNSDEPVAEVASALRATMPVDRIHEVNTTLCQGQECLVYAKLPAERACPYVPDVLGHQPDAAEQRAALADSRCASLRGESRYFGVRGLAGYGLSLTMIIDESAAGAVSGIPAEDVGVVTAALRAGKIVVDNPDTVDSNGNVTLAMELEPPGDTGQRTVSGPAFALPHRPNASVIMMTSPTATALGLGKHYFGSLATTTRMPTVAESDRLQATLGTEYFAVVERGSAETERPLTILAIVAGIITLGAAAIAAGLTAADGRADLSTLAAIGASPGLRRRLSLSQTGVIAGVGSVLGAVAAVGTSAAVTIAFNQGLAGVWPAPQPYPVVLPWLNLAIAVVVVPVVAMIGAGLFTRSRLPIEHRL